MSLENDESKENALDIKQIMEALPHRYPFLLVDKVIALDKEKKKIVAIKNVTINEEFFKGHFPGEPIMPGVLITEALAQAGGILSYQLGMRGLFVFSSIKNVRFRKLVRPGDVLILTVEVPHVTQRGGRMIGVAKVADKMAAEAELLFALLPNEGHK